MAIPNLRALREAKIAKEGVATIVCVHCRNPLWKVHILGQYGTRFMTREEAFPGVPEYADYWSKKHKGYSRTDCPFCGEQFFDLVMDRHGQKIAKPRTLEFG